ncbi:hypothetical protein JOC85_001878 [Bacillus mesophilus]|uniref:YhfM-like domain-containing protein n=1 Tax=Bacillus mesophilus TaxID=1808955 RepID=A0A6M0Q518_9BACI|nr:hypothetical protein [Bacillus mesophilus]MBM7661106.1 hypothetical protein [Bacillus mesophilus]NEY71362.1 hypothetical protein [Bacillus mesophilus]
MWKLYLSFFLLFIITSCSSNDIKSVEQIELIYWENENSKTRNEYVDDQEAIEIFVDTVNNAEELGKQKIITTKPLLSFSLGLGKEENKNYHLWVTESGEGYIQRLLPDANGTFKIDDKSVEKLKSFFEEKEDVSLISSAIEFEKID